MLIFTKKITFGHIMLRIAILLFIHSDKRHAGTLKTLAVKAKAKPNLTNYRWNDNVLLNGGILYLHLNQMKK
jgi:hypothetical protein